MPTSGAAPTSQGNTPIRHVIGARCWCRPFLGGEDAFSPQRQPCAVFLSGRMDRWACDVDCEPAQLGSAVPNPCWFPVEERGVSKQLPARTTTSIFASMDRAQELEHLRQAERHIDEAKALIETNVSLSAN
jgi:hypothetical protein